MTSEQYRSQVAGAVTAVSFESQTQFRWFDQLSGPPSRQFARLLTPASERKFLVSALEVCLYNNFYISGGATPARASTHHTSSAPHQYVDALSEANTGVGHLEDGWTIADRAPDIFNASKGGLVLRVREADIVRVSGELTALRFPNELRTLSPGFYIAVGNRDLPPDEQIARLYWHISPLGAVSLVRELTLLLNGAEVPFRLKALNDPSSYDRCDAVVVYLPREALERLQRALAEVWAHLEAELRDPVPALTLELAPGLGFAEDPLNGLSFGEHRCALLAEGLVRAREREIVDQAGCVAAIESTFAEAGISLATPYLKDNPGSPVAPFGQSRKPLRRRRPQKAKVGRAIDSAASIGREICQAGIWHEGLCNWLAGEPLGGEHLLRNLGPSLYDGTAGVGLFLAQLAGISGDAGVKRTAIGALNHALLRSEALDAEDRYGLYTGVVGVALAATRAGLTLREPALVERAGQLAGAIASKAGAAQRGFDLISGRAGMVAGLLALREVVDDSAFLENVVQIGDALVGSAESLKTGVAWATPGRPHEQPLTGFGHGTAGAVHALLVLYEATGERRFRELAVEAINYEDSWLDESTGNWPDFRDVTRRSRSLVQVPGFLGWCHGAPGIALARLKAYEVLREPRYRTTAEVALATTGQALEEHFGDDCLCHGAAGFASVLMLAGRRLGNANLLRQGEAALRHLASREHLLHDSPGLFTGRSGVGLALLAGASAEHQSILLIE